MFFFQAEDGIRDLVRSRGLGDVYKRQMMNLIRDEINQNKTWNKIGNGRKPKKDIVQKWRLEHPEGKKADCIRDTGLTKPTVYKLSLIHI